MTKINVFAGICGFSTRVISTDQGGYKAKLNIISECPNWKKVNVIFTDKEFNVMTELFKDKKTGTLHSEVIDISTLDGSEVKFGATVKIADEETDEEKTYQIVGEAEADLKAGKISITSPIARALIGKAEGASVEVNTPKGVKYYELVDVKFV